MGAVATWRRWKRLWRRLEMSDPVERTKRWVRQRLGTELPYRSQVRVRGERRGDWWYAPDYLSPESIVYSLGVGNDVDLDLSLIERYGLVVHAFDPTPSAVEWVRRNPLPERFRFHPVGVAGFDGEAEFGAPSRAGNPSYSMLRSTGGAAAGVTAPVRRLRTLVREAGHERIDLLKIDIEGAEYEVLSDLADSGIPVMQLLVEFHHRFAGVGNEPTRRAVECLLAGGYRIFHVSPTGREYSFIHADAVPEKPPRPGRR
jgi:FkbM family methyltransferase